SERRGEISTPNWQRGHAGLIRFELPCSSYIAPRGRGGRCSATVRNSFRNNGSERGNRALPADCMNTGSNLVIVGDGEFARIDRPMNAGSFEHSGLSVTSPVSRAQRLFGGWS